MDKRRITIGLTTWNRYEETLRAFVNVANDDRIETILVVDDASDIEIFKKLETALSFCPKVKLYRNSINLDCALNKRRVIELCETDWLVLFDSDNELTTDYIDRLYEIPEWNPKLSYMPSWAMPLFDYRHIEGVTLSRANIAEYIDKPMVETCCNCMNYFINRNEFLKVWKTDINPQTYDSLYQNYNWFVEGNGMYIVPNLFYTHNVHEKSHYRLNVHKSGNLGEELKQKMKQLR